VMGNRKDYVERGSMVTPEMAQAMEEAFQQVLTETRRALREHSEIVKGLVELLLEREELLADEVRAYFDQFGLYTPEATMVRDGEEISILTPRLPDEKAPVAAAGK